MRHWDFYQVVLLLLGIGIVTIALVAFDAWRVGDFAVAIPGGLSLWRIVPILRAFAPVLPIATFAIVVGPLTIVACTIWWTITQSVAR